MAQMSEKENHAVRNIGFQLYSARNFPPLSTVLKTVGAAGYRTVEGYDALYASLDDAALSALKADMDESGITMPSAHFGLDLLETDPARTIHIAGMLGIAAIYCPYLPSDRRPADATGWKAFGERLEKAGKPLYEAGLDFGWHNHDFEFFPLPDGSIPQDHIFSGGPNVSWEADIAWIIRGGADPFAFIGKYGNRITAVHVKDIAATGENADQDGWADVGYGTVEWKRLFQALGNTPARYYVVEHDNPTDFKATAERSIASIGNF